MSTADPIRLDKLNAVMRSVWGRGQTLHLIAGAMAFLYWMIPLFLFGMLIDWLTEMPTAGRVVILATLLLVSLQRAWSRGWRHLRLFNPVHTALLIESHHDDLKSLLVSAIQLNSQAEPKTASLALSHHTCQLAEQAAADLRPKQTVPFHPLHRPAVYAAIGLTIIGLFAAFNGSFLAVGFARLFPPWLSIEYPTKTQIILDQQELVVKEGDSAKITAQLSGIMPDRATIYVRTGEGRARAIDLDVLDNACKYTITSASRDFSYRLTAGDDRTSWHRVRVVPAPRIESVTVTLDYPDYQQRATQSIEALTLTVPEATRLHWAITLDRPIKTAAFVRDGESPVALTVSEDGRSLDFSEQAVASQGYHFTWVDQEQGYEFTSPRYFLQVASDQAPRVELTSPTSNLVAMLNRPLDLSVRVQDDHGIGSAQVIHRVNQFDEAFVDLPADALTGQGDQTIDWDYREAIADLKIGDTVSFSIQVSDRYPGDDGPHVVRSDTRRITFLSKEQYLEQIDKQRNRLLSRVQTIYRQQRSAHDLTSSLSPKGEGFLQACQLEGIRQEMIRGQLNEIAARLQDLRDDLAANNLADVPEADAMQTVQAKLTEIAESQVAQAASLLRDLSTASNEEQDASDPVPAARAVNAAARELGSLVMLRGIEAAQEVYAREVRMLAQQQANLRWQTLVAPAASVSSKLVKQQHELAQWTEQLINDLLATMRYDQHPLAVLRLVRSIKDLQAAKVSEQMRIAGTQIDQEQRTDASALQAELVKSLLNAEFSVRLSGAYATLIKTRDLIGSMSVVQTRLQTNGQELSATEFTSRRREITDVQAALRKQLLTLMLPTVPARRANLFDETLPKAPPIDALLAEANDAMSQALTAIDSGEQQAMVNQQRQAQQTLDKLFLEVERWSIEMGLESQGLSTVVAATSERMSRLEEFEARIIGLLEKTDLTAAEDSSLVTLAETQLNLASDLSALIKALNKEDLAQNDRDLPPVLSQIERAEQLLNKATTALKANDADQAIDLQEQAADALAEGYAIVVAQNQRLTSLQGMLMFQRSVGFANRSMGDIVAEQRELLAETEALKPEEMKVLLPRCAHLQQCMHDVAPLLDLVAARLDVGTPLAFAKTDFEDAMAALKTGDQFEAIDAQDVAAESLGDVQLLVQDIRTQTGYLAEIVHYLHQHVSDASLMAYQQRELRQDVTAFEQEDLSRFLDAQQALLKRAIQQDKRLRAAAGNPKLVPPPDPLFPSDAPSEAQPVLSLPSQDMQLVLDALQDNDKESAAEAMELAELLYAENSEAVLVVITMLEGLPQVAINSESDPALVRLVETLAVASDFKTLFRETQDAGDLESLSKRQNELTDRLSEIAGKGESHPLLDSASKHLGDAVSAFSTANRDQLRKSQRAADEQLRHFIVEQALILNTAIPPNSASDAPAADGPGSDTESAITAGFIADFVSGETPSDKRSEWKVLGERNRAALNQNFARELPLEYRGLLKNYYERVAQ